MKSPFPGMDPYLEQPGLWEEVHGDLIGGIRRFLTPMLRPRYRVAVEQRTYLTVLPPTERAVGKPDVLVVSPKDDSPGGIATVATPVAFEPTIGQLPMPEEVVERFLEIRNVATQEVITVIEILSPANKRPGEGRRQYESKRLKVLGSLTNLVEIDLLRGGEPMAMTVDKENDYRIVISRSEQRPQADIYLFSVRRPIPDFPIPLQPGEPEPTLKLNQILHELYDRSGYDLAIDYYQDPPAPKISTADLAWIKQVIQDFSSQS